jgi:hypothetical protein
MEASDRIVERIRVHCYRRCDPRMRELHEERPACADKHYGFSVHVPQR